ncbi:MAG: hypothetical protein HGB12_07420 [Bacteroidetes bacterium]|nr:hypothetical protein [Bacteroidota bacterium]
MKTKKIQKLKKVLKVILYIFFIFNFSLLTFNSFSQGVGINVTGSPAVNSAILDLQPDTTSGTTSQGLLIPRMGTDKRPNSPAKGLMIFNTDCLNFQYYDGAQWVNLNNNPNYSVNTPGLITGSASVCANQTGVTYSVAAVSGATSYNWTLPAGATISSGTGTSSITVTFGSNSGNLSVIAVNSCGMSSASTLTITITPTVGTPSTPTPSASTICQGSSNTAYTTSATNTTTYNWTVTGTGNTISGTGTTGTVTWNTGFSGTATVSVTATGCGTSAAASTTVTVNPLPATPTATASTAVSSTRITANWNTAIDATSYLLDVSTATNFASFVGSYNGLNAGNVLTYNVTGLTPSTTYYYRVRGANSCGSGENSSTITATTINIAANIVAYWKLDEASGSASDISGNSNTLTNANVTYGTGNINNGAIFNSTTDHLSRAYNNFDFERTDPFSISLWINKVTLVDNNFMISHQITGGTWNGYSLYLSAAGQVYCDIYSNTSSNCIAIKTTSNYVTSTGTWYHIVLTSSGSSTVAGIKIYVNGVSRALTVVSDNLTASIKNTTDLVLGNRSDGYNFTGTIDEVGIWSRSLTAAEITTLYNSGAGLQYPF